MTRNGLIVSPAIEQIDLQAGQTNTSFDASVTNDTPTAVTIVVRTDDFTAFGDTGSALFLNNTNHQATAHGLSHWMTVTPSVLSLRSGEAGSVSIAITGIGSMAPGGHYGAVIFGILPVAATPTGQNIIASNAEVSILTLLTTADSGTESIQLAKPNIAGATLTMPSSMNILFTNVGNVQTSPHGIVTVYDRSNNEVARGIINVDSGVVLPDTSRLYQVTLSNLSKFNWPGQYHVSIFYRAGDSGHGMLYNASFVYVNQSIVVLLGLIPAVAILLLIRRLGVIFIHYRLK